MKSPPDKRVAILQNKESGYCRGIIHGALRFVETNSVPWCLQDAPPVPGVIDSLCQWEPDGVIAHCVDIEFSKKLLDTGIPIISTSQAIPGYPAPTYDVDHHAVGRMAAEYFLKRGLQNFAFFGSDFYLFSTSRESGMRTYLEKHGYSLSVFHSEVEPIPPPSITWADFDESVAKWLEALERPIGILASNDNPARRLLEVCHRLGISVPQEVAILGVDNDDSECRMATPPLSSIAIPSEKNGYRSAEALHRHISGEAPLVNGYHTIEPLYCVPRQSTDVLSCIDPVVSRALSIIEEDIVKGISVDDLAQKVGQSRRSLERKFKEHLKCTILDQLHYTHIELSQRLLVETDLSISEIAERCGLASIRRFNQLFRKKTNTTPSEYRSLNRYSN